jgi:hypothetical protein
VEKKCVKKCVVNYISAQQIGIFARAAAASIAFRVHFSAEAAAQRMYPVYYCLVPNLLQLHVVVGGEVSSR